MSNKTTIRALFSNMVNRTKVYTVDGLANIKAAQQFAHYNGLYLEESSDQVATKFRIIPHQQHCYGRLPVSLLTTLIQG